MYDPEDVYLAVAAGDAKLYEFVAEAYAAAGLGQLRLWFGNDEQIGRAFATHDYFLAGLGSKASLGAIEDVARTMGRPIAVRSRTVIGSSPIVIGWRREIAASMREPDLSSWNGLLAAHEREGFRCARASGATTDGAIVFSALEEAARRLRGREAPAVVEAFEKATARYAESEAALADVVMQSEAAAFIAQEWAAIDICARTEGRYVLAAPSEGTLLVERPLVFGIAAGEMHEPRVRHDDAAFQTIETFLTADAGASAVALAGFRPPGGRTLPAGSLNSYFSPAAAATPSYWTFPTARALKTAQQRWGALKRNARIVLLVDVSGSMAEGNKLIQVQSALRRFVDETSSDRDWIGLISFSSDVRQEIPLTALSAGRSALRAVVDRLEPSGQTRLLDGVSAAARELERDRDDSQKGVVVLSDGEENASRTSLDEVLQQLRAIPGIVVYCVGYLLPAESRFLKALADATRGEVVEGRPESVVDIFARLSKRF
jgi:von Willebrand factor type A domain-containing protein